MRMYQRINTLPTRDMGRTSQLRSVENKTNEVETTSMICTFQHTSTCISVVNSMVAATYISYLSLTCISYSIDSQIRLGTFIAVTDEKAKR